MRWCTGRSYAWRVALRALRRSPEWFGDADFLAPVDFDARFDFRARLAAVDDFGDVRVAFDRAECPWPSAASEASFADARGGSFLVASSNCRCSDPIIRPSDSADRINSDSSFRGRRAGSTRPRLAIARSSSRVREQATGQCLSPGDRKRRAVSGAAEEAAFL
jgi:hypothetical protein